MRLDDLVTYLDDYLRVAEVGDFDRAHNGLQVENGGEVRHVAVAVDACQAVIDQAGERGADMLIVHHGLFWSPLEPLTGRSYRRVASLLRHGIAVYASHLPLDRHPVVGNNPILARLLSIDARGWWGESHGAPIGVWGELDISRDALRQRLGEVLGERPFMIPGGPEQARRIGIITGSAGSMIAQAREAGLDTFITGEGAHHTFFDAEELGINVMYGGHYHTEKFGVQALAEHIAERFQLQWSFIDHPTGL